MSHIQVHTVHELAYLQSLMIFQPSDSFNIYPFLFEIQIRIFGFLGWALQILEKFAHSQTLPFFILFCIELCVQGVLDL